VCRQKNSNATGYAVLLSDFKLRLSLYELMGYCSKGNSLHNVQKSATPLGYTFQTTLVENNLYNEKRMFICVNWRLTF